jgi:protein ImuB
VIQPGTCAVRVRGPARYFGGEFEAAQAVALRLRRLDLPSHCLTWPRFGVAETAFAAEQAARVGTAADQIRVVPEGHAAEFVADLPVSVLGQPELAGVLRRLGLHTLGDFAGLAGRDVLQRFGPLGAYAHRLAGGGDQRPLASRRPPPELTRWIELDDPADRVDQVAFAVRRSSEEFVADLAAEGLVCTTVRIIVVSEDGPGVERCWLHPGWFGAADLIDRLRWQLQGDAGVDTGLRSRVARVCLVPEEVDPIGTHADGLWGSGPDEKVQRALIRVQSQLGHGAVVSAVVGGGRAPADRSSAVPWGDRRVARHPSEHPWPGAIPAPGPTTVYTQPRPALVLTADHQVVTIDDRGVLNGSPAWFSPSSVAAAPMRDLLPVDGWAGPWPVSERWWDESQARSLTRFLVVGADGSAWLLILDAGRWWTEARYD